MAVCAAENQGAGIKAPSDNRRETKAKGRGFITANRYRKREGRHCALHTQRLPSPCRKPCAAGWKSG